MRFAVPFKASLIATLARGHALLELNASQAKKDRTKAENRQNKNLN